MHVVAIDPGRMKCGMAILSDTGDLREQFVVARSDVFTRLTQVHQNYGAFYLVVGDGTGSKEFLQELEAHPIAAMIPKVHVVDEHLSSLEARSRYFDDHPPKGMRRFIPRSLQVPPVPFDDYVAVILAERYLAGRKDGTSSGQHS